jgi:hypothetical protein
MDGAMLCKDVAEDTPTDFKSKQKSIRGMDQ